MDLPDLPSSPASPAACANHPNINAAEQCRRCSRPFCEDCLIEFEGQLLCGTCKPLAVRDLQRRSLSGDREAHNAFMFSLLAVVCVPLILSPVALIRGIRALRKYREDPTLPGRWKAVASVVISSIMTAVAVISVGLSLLPTIMGR